MKKRQISQEQVVVILAALMFVTFSVVLDGFLSAGNVVTLLKNVAILGTLAIGMGFVVVGRGIDLSMVATMVLGIAFSIWVAGHGLSFGTALLLGAGVCICMGLMNGLLVAFGEVPPIFATLGTGSAIYGAGRVLFGTDVMYLPPGSEWMATIGSGRILGVPVTVIAFAAIAAIIGLFMSATRFGRFIYAAGDNPFTARAEGVPTRVVTVVQYVIVAIIAFLAGVMMAGLVSGINTRLHTSTLVYDVLLVVVLGGIGLSGGRGGVRNIIVGTLLVGIFVNGMTIMNISYSVQNLIKSAILLLALLADSIVNPRDEQTSQSGDI